MPAAWGRSSGTGQMRVSNGMRCVFAYVNANSIGLRLRRRLAPQDCRIEVEQGGDDFPAIVQRGRPDEPILKLHAVVTEQPRLTLQPADERRHIAIVGTARLTCSMTNAFHGPARCRVRSASFDEVLDEGAAAHASIDVSAELGIERDGSLQQE